MQWFSKVLWLLILALLATECIEPFQPPLTSETTNMLVVEGFINTTSSSASVKLTKANTLSKSQQFQPETKARVTIESEDGVKYNLLEKTGGNYELTALVLNAAKKYRLRVIRLNGKVYTSDFITLSNAAILDQVGWTPEQDGVNIHVDAHDPTSKTHYYKWNYSETWEYTSLFSSAYKLVSRGVPVPRTPNELIHTCWRTDLSSAILVHSTARLSEDIVHRFPLAFLPVGTAKLTRLYSILVRQRGISEEEYSYWQQLQKTTENLGGLFDPLPTQVTGNLHSEGNSSEPVLGYFSGGSVQEKRIFISPYDLPSHLWRGPTLRCSLDSIPNAKLGEYPSSTLLIAPYGISAPIGYLTSTPDCIDCRLAGGITTRPDFWP